MLVDPPSDPLSGTLLGGGDFDPLGVMGGGEAPTLNTPSPGAAGAQDESKKSTSASSSANAAAEGKDGVASGGKISQTTCSCTTISRVSFASRPTS